MPVNHGVDAHKLRPPLVRRAKVLQVLAVRVGSSGAHKDGPHRRRVGEVRVQGRPHGHCVLLEVQVVLVRRLGHKLLNLGKRVRRRNVHGLDSRHRGVRCRRRRLGACRGQRRQAGEQQHQQAEAVLSAIIRERQFFKPKVSRQRCSPWLAHSLLFGLAAHRGVSRGPRRGTTYL